MTRKTTLNRTIDNMHDGWWIPEDSSVWKTSTGKTAMTARTARNQTKTITYQFEARVGQNIESETQIMLWLIMWSGLLWNRYHVKQDGKTTYENIRGRMSGGT